MKITDFAGSLKLLMIYALLFNPVTANGNKRSYVLKQTCS